MDKREQIIQEFKGGINTVFGNLVEYVFLSGRFAYGTDEKGKCDIDVITVLKNEFENVDSKIAQEMIKKAASTYLEIHAKYGYKPDMLFPGEYITSKQVEDSLNGRGYHLRNGNVYLPIVCSDDYWLRYENEYRAWRSMSAFNNASIISGKVKSKLNDWQEITINRL